MTTCAVLATIDVSELQRAIPEIVAFGRRTMIEQCVTSAAFICIDAQKRTTYVEIGTIDAELDVDKTPVRKPRTFAGAALGKYISGKTVMPESLSWTEGMMIAVQRTNPASPYSVSTGNRWPLAYSGGLKGHARWAFFVAAAERMKAARHSSTHFLQHGWAGAIGMLLADPNYYAGRSKVQIRAQAKINPINTMNHEQLGSAMVELSGDECLVTADNAVGEGQNSILDKTHRDALIAHGTVPLQEAIEAETLSLNQHAQKNFDKGMTQNFGYL